MAVQKAHLVGAGRRGQSPRARRARSFRRRVAELAARAAVSPAGFTAPTMPPVRRRTTVTSWSSGASREGVAPAAASAAAEAAGGPGAAAGSPGDGSAAAVSRDGAAAAALSPGGAWVVDSG